MNKQKKTKDRLYKGNLTKASEIIPVVKENLSLEKSFRIIALQEIWPLVTSFEIAKYSTPSYFDKENNLVIATKSSTVATELSMQKITILKKLIEATKDTDIRFKDIRIICK